MDLIFPEKKEAFARLVSGLDSVTELGSPVNVATSYPPSEITRRIDQDTAHLDEFSRILKTRRNDFTPVFSLPPEVMGSILELCARIEPPQAGPVGPTLATRGWKARIPATHEKLGWIKMGHICQRLRSVVLGMPALWASIAFTLPKGHEEILVRAQSAPLTIELIHQPPAGMPQITISRLQFARRIALDLVVPEAEDLWSSLATIERPNSKVFSVLENLSVSAARLLEDITTSSLDAAPIRAPRLRRLKLQNHFVPCNFSSLETLDLDLNLNLPIPYEARNLARPHKILDGDIVREILSRCTNLRRLALCGTQFGILPAPSGQHAAISLTRLKHLRLRTPISFARSIWSNIILGSETQIELQLYDMDTTFDENIAATRAAEENVFLSTLLSRLGAPNMPKVIGVRLECRVNIETRLVLAVKKLGTLTFERQGPLAEDCQFILDVRVARPERDRTMDAPSLFMQLLQDLPKYVDLAGVETLALYLPRLQGYPAVTWCTILVPYMSVRSLIVDELPFQDSLWNAFCPAPDSGARPVLPSVVALFVLPDRLMAGGTYGFPPGEKLPQWEDILIGFRHRAEACAGIQQIVFGMFARVEAEQLDELKTVVPQVVDTRLTASYEPGEEFF